ncbi:MAG: 3'-5' exonuclease, partial [Candidatus Kryptonium sp.]
NGNGWKFYDSELTLTSGCEICDETDVGAEIPAYVEMNDIDDQERQERNEEFEKLIKNSTVGIIGRSRNSCKKVKDYVTTTSSEIFFRDRAGFDIKEEKEILWFDTILKLKTGETTSLQLLAMLELKQLLELNKEEKNTSTQEEKNNTSEEQNEKQKEGQKLLKEIIFKKDWILKLMNRVEDLVGQNVTLNYINTQRTITELLGSFILSEVTKNKIFNEQEHRNLLHFLSTLYTIEKRRDAYNLWYYKLIVSDLMEEQIYDTPSVWGQPQKGVVEVTTIHSAKGLEYDVVFFLEDDLEKLTKNDIDGSRLEKEIYPFEIEVENNNIQLLWSPVNIKKLISNKDVRKRIKNQQNSDILKTANKYIFSSIQENFNLAYVLITRAKRKIVKCTTDRKKKTAKNI